MLPFDLDLASSGFVDAHGQRWEGSSARVTTVQTGGFASSMKALQDIRVEFDRSQPPSCAEVPEGLSSIRRCWRARVLTVLHIMLKVLSCSTKNPGTGLLKCFREELSSLIGQRIQAAAPHEDTSTACKVASCGDQLEEADIDRPMEVGGVALSADTRCWKLWARRTAFRRWIMHASLHVSFSIAVEVVRSHDAIKCRMEGRGRI